MKTHDVQSISINVAAEDLFEYVARPANLPRWTSAFAEANDVSARLRTSAGEVAIKLDTLANRQSGTIGWVMIFPDGAVGVAYSRVTPGRRGQVGLFDCVGSASSRNRAASAPGQDDPPLALTPGF